MRLKLQNCTKRKSLRQESREKAAVERYGGNEKIIFPEPLSKIKGKIKNRGDCFEAIFIIFKSYS